MLKCESVEEIFYTQTKLINQLKHIHGFRRGVLYLVTEQNV